MSQLSQFLPIVIMIALIGMITIIIIKRNGNHIKHRKTKINQRNFVKRVQLVVCVYVAVLLISVGLFFLIPSEEESAFGKQDAPKDRWFLHESFLNRNISEGFDTFIKKKWNFTYQADQLTLEELSNQNGMIDIFVDVQNNKSDTIEVTYYQTPVVVDNRQVTEQIPFPQIKLSSTSMTFRNPEQVEINFTTFKKEFPFTLFSGEKWWDERINLGEQIILIQVPEGLELKYGPEMNVNYVGGTKN